jgi:hypothetical protein
MTLKIPMRKTLMSHVVKKWRKMQHVVTNRWINHSFIKPVCVLVEMSSYPHLMALYKILASLAVTSCSAERVLTHVRVIKNRLRTSMADDWVSALTIFATEFDMMRTISVDKIIIFFTEFSTRLREHLL